MVWKRNGKISLIVFQLQCPFKKVDGIFKICAYFMSNVYAIQQSVTVGHAFMFGVLMWLISKHLYFSPSARLEVYAD